jgi:putative phage-type endonuclease
MITEGQRKARVNGVGASECAAALGVSRYATPLDIYARKVNAQTYSTAETDAIRWGNLLEPVILDAYESMHGVTLERSPNTIVCKEFPFMFAHLDAMVVGVQAGKGNLLGRVVEAKSSGIYAPREWGPDGSDQVPMEYLLQVHHQMMCVGAKVGDYGDLAVLIGGNDFRVYHIPFDPGLSDMISLGLRKFWEMVIGRTPPKAKTVEDLDKLYVVTAIGRTINATTDVEQQAVRLADLLADVDRLKGHIEEAEFFVKGYMQDADALVSVDGTRTLATWKQYKGALRFDSKAFAIEHPDMYAKFSKRAADTRRFSVKGKK